MGGHWRFGGGHHGQRGHHGGHGGYGYFGRPPEYSERRAAPLGKPKPILWVIAILAAGLWSLAAWLAYGLVDPFFSWLSALGPFASWSPSGGISGLLGQAIALLQTVAKPAILIVWAVGALGLLAAPMILPAILRLRGRFHH